MDERAPEHQPVQLTWQINDLRLAGLSWGDPEGKPLLALHGWLDNAASFALLAPLLEGFHVVALDLTGHGQSAHRSLDASYQIWDDLPEILGVLESLGWDSFYLMGHSRGAIIACLLASAFPERVRSLVLLDALMPQPVAAGEFPLQIRKAIHDKSRLLARPNRVFTDVEHAAATRDSARLPAAAARILVQRNLRSCAEGVTWTTDARLRGATAVKMTEAQINAVLSGLSMPVLLLLAKDYSMQMPGIAEHAKRIIERVTVHSMPGGHHFHMESGVSAVALKVREFLIRTEECETA